MSVKAFNNEFDNLQPQEKQHRQQKQQQQSLHVQQQIYAQQNRNYFNKVDKNIPDRTDMAVDVGDNKPRKLTSSNTKSRFKSTPNLFEPSSSTSSSAYTSSTQKQDKSTKDNLSSSNESEEFLRGHSESDLTKIPDNNPLVNAKSEFHLKTIVSTKVEHDTHERNINNGDGTKKLKTSSNRIKLRQQRMPTRNSMMSSMLSGSMASSISDRARSQASGFADTENIRIPIIGYEVMEERARFTVCFIQRSQLF